MAKKRPRTSSRKRMRDITSTSSIIRTTTYTKTLLIKFKKRARMKKRKMKITIITDTIDLYTTNCFLYMHVYILNFIPFIAKIHKVKLWINSVKLMQKKYLIHHFILYIHLDLSLSYK